MVCGLANGRAGGLRCGVALALVLYAGTASAQQIRNDISVGVRTLHESNPLHLPGSGGRRADSRITPTISLDLSRSAGRYGVYIKGDAGYDFHRRFRELDAARVAMEAGATARVAGRCAVALTARADIQQSDPGDVGVTSNRSNITSFGLKGRCPRPAGLFPELRLAHVTARNSDPLRASLEYRLADVTAALFYARPTIGTFGAYYYFGALRHPSTAPVIAPDVDFHRVGLTFDRAVAARLEMRAALGHIRAEPRSGPGIGNASSYSGTDWKTELRWLLAPERSIVASYERQIRAESNLAATFVVAMRAAIEADFRLGGRTRLALGASDEIRSLRGARAFGGLPARERDRTLRLAARLDYRLTPDMLLGAEVTHARRKARPDTYDYRSTGAGLRITYTF